MKIGAVVVTFNRKLLLIECLKALLEQSRPLDKIYICDNASTDNTEELLLEKGYISDSVIVDKNQDFESSHQIKLSSGKIIDIIYLRSNENSGGAGGFSRGLERACNDMNDWVWLMDDDGRPALNSLEILQKGISNFEKLAAISCVVISKNDSSKLAFKLPVLDKSGRFMRHDGQKSFYDLKSVKNYAQSEYYPWANFFNGVLINRKAFLDVGNIKKELFIWGDEQDYLFRLFKWGKVVTSLEAFHYHPDDNKVNPPLWKVFYGFRNELYLSRVHRGNFLVRFVYISLLYLPYFLKKRALAKYFKAIYESFKL